MSTKQKILHMIEFRRGYKWKTILAQLQVYLIEITLQYGSLEISKRLS